ncbi:hypothetical protein Q8G47_28310, partial [Klebsiella pneumoniae]|uniref:hypothetical protein n=1 Tax=Klebsiella pneumoniae TaxID=573 RepID=UPI003013B318
MGEATIAGRQKELLAKYRALGQTYDELLGADGTVRPLWRPLVNELTRLSAEQVEGRIARGDEYLRDAGVYLRQFG